RSVRRPSAPRVAAAAAGSASIAGSRDDAGSLDALVTLEADLKPLEIVVRPPSVEHDAVDEIVLRRSIAVGIPREILAIGAALVDEAPRGLEIDIGPVHRSRGLGVPIVGLALLDLPPTPHLREIPDRVGVVRVRREVTKEHVEIGQAARVAALVLERSGHRARDDLEVRADVFRTREHSRG